MTLDTLLYHKEITEGNHLEPIEGGNPMTGETGWNPPSQRQKGLFLKSAGGKRKSYSFSWWLNDRKYLL